MKISFREIPLLWRLNSNALFLIQTTMWLVVPSWPVSPFCNKSSVLLKHSIKLQILIWLARWAYKLGKRIFPLIPISNPSPQILLCLFMGIWDLSTMPYLAQFWWRNLLPICMLISVHPYVKQASSTVPFAAIGAKVAFGGWYGWCQAALIIPLSCLTATTNKYRYNSWKGLCNKMMKWWNTVHVPRLYVGYILIL